MSQSPAFILRRNPFRDNSLLLDLLTEQQGKITCVAKYSKQQSQRIRGVLEPFRQLEVTWQGRGEVFSLIQADEQRRYSLKGGALIKATYATEVLLRGSWVGQPIPALFAAYRALLSALSEQDNMGLLLQFEWAFLTHYGYEPNVLHNDIDGEVIQPEQHYVYHTQQGLVPQAYARQYKLYTGTAISGALLIALRQPEVLDSAITSPTLLVELRQVLDKLLALHLNGNKLYARQLLI